MKMSIVVIFIVVVLTSHGTLKVIIYAAIFKLPDIFCELCTFSFTFIYTRSFKVVVLFYEAFFMYHHSILLHKLSHYPIRDMTNCWFPSLFIWLNIIRHSKWISVYNAFNMTYQKGSVLGPLLSWHVNKNAIKYSQHITL